VLTLTFVFTREPAGEAAVAVTAVPKAPAARGRQTAEVPTAVAG
jgi:hypothetical protein